MLIAAVCLSFVIVFSYKGEKKAFAASNDLEFSVELGIYEDGVWEDYTPGSVSIGKPISFRFTFEGDPELSVTEFNYIFGNSRQDVINRIENDQWQTSGENNEFLKPQNMMIDGMRIWTYPVEENFDGYIVFRATMREIVGGEPVTREWVHGTTFRIRFQKEILPTNIMIMGVDAYYLSNGEYLPYDTDLGGENKWVSTEMKFVVTTRNIIENLGLDELFYYSIDNGENWYPAGVENEIYVKRNINGRVHFKVTDISGKIKSVFPQPEDSQIYVKMDIVEPDFSVSAVSTRYEDGRLVTFPYNQNLWSYNDVVYIITPEVWGESPIVYEYRTPGNAWNTLTYSPASGYYTLSLTTSTYDIEFRATSEALKSVTKSGYHAKIDKVQPRVSITAYDATNTEIRSFGTAEGEGYRVGYASDTINFTVYNKAANGALIRNNSELKCQYKYTYYDNNGILQETNFQDMIRHEDKEQGVYYYTFSQSVYDPTPIDKRIYTFRLESESGLSDERTFTATILYSVFEISIEVDPDAEVIKPGITWANAPIPVYIYAPIMDKYTFAYFVDGEETRFVWAADGSGDSEDVVKDVTEEYRDLEPGEPGYVPEGMAKFRIYITKSVDRKIFDIYAYNAAEVKNDNEEQTGEIRLDMVTPNVRMSAVVQHSQYAIESGQWANGNIELTLDSKALPASEISLSGIDCELMLDHNIPYDVLESEKDSDGLPIGKFIHIIEIPEGQGNVFTTTLIFRLTSGSGLQNFVYFDVKIDKREIELEKVYDYRNEDIILNQIDNPPFFTDTTDPVCKDIGFKFFTNQQDHFSYWYRIDDPEGNFTKGSGEELWVSIPQNSKGEIIVQFYLESDAIDFNNQKSQTNIYTIIIPYDCVSVQISIAIQDKMPEYNEDQEGWVNGPMSILISLLEENLEYEDLTYGIIILGDKTPAEFYSENGLTNENQYSNIYEFITPISLISGMFDFWGVDDNGVPRFDDPTGDTRKCFYTGNMLICAFNKARYSSNVIYLFSEEIKVDNSTPDVTLLIESLNGEIERGFDNGNAYINVYNNQSIVLKDPQFTDRANIDYYYYSAADGEPEEVPDGEELNGWTKLAAGNSLTITGQSAFYLYAINSLGKQSSSNGEKFTFIVDTLQPTFSVDFPQDQGASRQTTIDGETYDIFTFNWTEQVRIGFSTNSQTGVYYWYSIDNKETWIRYNQTPIDQDQTTFVFSEDIYATMFFKMTNQAGYEVEHIHPAVVRIDTQRPDFSLEAYVGGIHYNGGGYGIIDENGEDLSGLSHADTSGQWAKSAVTIVIRLDPEKRNTSPVKYQYKVVTAVGETPYVETPSNTVHEDMITFTTDRMDNFSENNDAIIVVQAICQGNNKVYTTAIRVKVDKVIPQFKLNGEVFISETATQALNSGEWTNKDEVRINIQRTNPTPNVSQVNVVYFIDDSTLENQWPMDGASYGMITCTRSQTIKAVSRTQSGIVYEEIFEVNIDTVAPVIESGTIVPSVTGEPNVYYIDQPITYREENLKSAQYITKKGDTVGFPLPQGHIIATNTVDNSEFSLGYVMIIIEDLAGNKATLEFYMRPFELNINNLTLSQEDMAKIDRYEEDLAKARGIDDSRRAYFESLIMRLRDRENTLRQEIAGFQSYLAGLAKKASYELKSDYREMHEYLMQYNNYAIINKHWIQEAIVQGEYHDHFLKFQEEYGKLAKEMERVHKVQDSTRLLPAINVVTVNDYNNVLQVYDAYTDLSPDQKSAFATTLFNKLITLKRKCENLLLQDEESGVRVDGQLAPGAKIEVTTYPNTIELYNNAQATILNSIPSDRPRTIVSIHKVGLTGAASQTETGEILVTIPIPDDYYNYVRFAVYRLSADGTVTEIKGVHIQGDGKSIQFSDDHLDTYILATRANIEVKETGRDIYGTLGDIQIDTQMLNYIAYSTIGVFTILIVVVVITSLRRRRFLNHYNKAHRKSLYKKGIQQIPKGNKPPREHPFKEDRVRHTDKPYI
ncbi:MAG: hypothetical protein ACOX2Y_06555 [Christensenellales bacterium]|jgi:hypothetical protein